MRRNVRLLCLIAACGVCWTDGSCAATDEDDEPADAAQADSQITLTLEQCRAIGIALAHPIAAKLADRIESLALVLDSTSLVADAGELATALAVQREVLTEVRRLTTLAAQDAGVSKKMLDSAQTEAAKARAHLQLATARYAQHWGPSSNLPARQREALIDSVASGESLVLRADWPGRHSIPAAPVSAKLDIDGLTVGARVLGALHSESPSDSAGVLLFLPRAPAGIAAGTRLPVSLQLATSEGFLLPGEAILYDEKSAYVFKQLLVKPNEKLRYVRVDIKLLSANGKRWLVGGKLDDDDDIVVAGAGALWSLEGLRGRVVDDDDD